MNNEEFALTYREKIWRPWYPFTFQGKWYLWRKVKRTYLLSHNKVWIPIKTELV